MLAHILNYLSPTICSTVRLTSRRFNAIIGKQTFGVLASFIDPVFAHVTLTAIATDSLRRPKSIWSPSCSVPSGLPLSENFLLAMFVALGGRSWRCGSKRPRLTDVEGETDDDTITVHDFRGIIGWDCITEGILTEAMFRYALYLSYTHPERESPHMWVFNRQLWMTRC